MKKFKLKVKFLFYSIGGYFLYHKLINRNRLTVLMFHRVLPPEESTRLAALEEWSISDRIFEKLMEFCKKLYNVVSLEQVYEAKLSGKKLPPNALLITFDDGWRDNYTYALPILVKHELTAAIFIASSAVNKRLPFWQEKITSACKLKSDLLCEIVNEFRLDSSVNDTTTLIHRLKLVENSEKKARITEICEEYIPQDRQFLSRSEIVELVSHNIAIGSHGATHEPLAHLDSQQQKYEIKSSAIHLASITRKPIISMSFPHGSYNSQIVKMCNQEGYCLMFDSTAKINRKLTSVISRLHVAEHAICYNGEFSRMKASDALFIRSTRKEQS